MTFFTLVFAYLGITEVYDQTELMIFKPKVYERLYGNSTVVETAEHDSQ